MSFLLALDTDKLDQIIPLLSKYEGKVKAAEPIFKIEGRRLEEVMRTLPHYQASYDEALQEIKALEDWVINIKEKKVGRLWKKYTEGYSRALGVKDITAYIAAEPDIFDINQILIEVVLIKNNLAAIVDAIKQLGWQCGSITKLRISEMEMAIL